jgi:hypothetical protein
MIRCDAAALHFPPPASDLRSNHGLTEETDMTWNLYRLTELHQRVDDALRVERRRPLPDHLQMVRLKKLKLSIKDRLTRMMRR